MKGAFLGGAVGGDGGWGGEQDRGEVAFAEHGDVAGDAAGGEDQ